MNTSKKKTITNTLLEFYEQPIAKVSLELFLTIGLIVFLAMFAIRPTVVIMSDLIKEIEDKQKLDEDLGRKIAALNTAQNEYLIYEDRLFVLEEAIPTQPMIINSLKIIEKTASDSNILINRITISTIPNEEISPTPFTDMKRINLPVTVSVTGDYPSIRTFIENLMDSRRAIIVDSVTFNLEEGRGVSRLKANIILNLPYYDTN